jgi:hypothetical protein
MGHNFKQHFLLQLFYRLSFKFLQLWLDLTTAGSLLFVIEGEKDFYC